MKGDKHPCPACNTKGFVKVGVEVQVGISEDKVVKKDIQCPLCKGECYTNKKYLPKMIQQGWIEEGIL